MVAQAVASSWRNNMKLRTATKIERQFGDYTVEHYNGDAHRAGDYCGLCAEHAKKAGQQWVKTPIEQTVMAQLAAVGAISNNALKKRYGYNLKKLRRTIGDTSGLDLDSLQMLQLIITLEVELGVKIADDDLSPAIFASVPTLTSFVERKMMEQRS